MKPEDQRLAIAEACGWHFDRSIADSPHAGLVNKPVWFRETDSVCRRLPDYLNDLNAMHAAEETLSTSQLNRMVDLLYGIPGRFWRATAAQRAEAFLKCIGKWVD